MRARAGTRSEQGGGSGSPRAADGIRQAGYLSESVSGVAGQERPGEKEEKLLIPE